MRVGIFLLSIVLNLVPVKASGQSPVGRLPTVLASNTLVADLCRIIGGDRYIVDSLTAPDSDPHSLLLGFKDVGRIRSADVVVRIGLGLERQIEPALKEFARHKPLITLASSLTPGRLLYDPTQPKRPDPHFWGDVSLWAKAAEYLAKEFGNLDRGRAHEFFLRGEEYRRRLMKLHEELQHQLRTPPPGQRIIVTPHHSLGYFGNAYGWESISLLGVVPQATSEVDEEQIRRDYAVLSWKLAEKSISLLFLESPGLTAIFDQLLEKAAIKGDNLIIGGTLTVDALGETSSPLGTYEAMMRANLETIRSGFKSANLWSPPKASEHPSPSPLR